MSGLYAAGDMSDEQMTMVGQLLRGEKIPYTPQVSMKDILREGFLFKPNSNYVIQRAKV